MATSSRVLSDAGTVIRDNEASEQGGGVFANSGAVVTGSLVTGNRAGSDGGGIAAPLGLLDTFGATISDNTVGATAGGVLAFRTNLDGTSVVDNHAVGDGGGVRSRQRGVIVDSRIAGNTTGGDGGGILRDAGTGTIPFEILSSTIDANSAAGAGDGLFLSGTRPVVVRNSTVSDDALAAFDAVVVLENVTLFNPTGLAVSSQLSTMETTNVLTVGACAAPLSDLGGSIESPGATCGFAATEVPTAGLIDPILADNGGPTPTHALPGASPALNSGVDPCPATDQRGVARNDGACDVGAYENTVFSACSPGYWKQRRHHDSWVDLTPDDQLADVFGRPIDGTLRDGLRRRGGGVNALIRHGVAAALNATHPELQPLQELDGLDEVVELFQAAFDSGDHEPTKDLFEWSNELGCDLS